MQKSRGELLLFSHDDVEIVSGDLAPAIARASASLDVIGGRRDAVGVSAEIAVIHASGGTFGDAWQRYANRFAKKHRDQLPAEAFPAKWSFARMLVASKEAIVREFPLERLMAITRQVRAAAPREPPL